MTEAVCEAEGFRWDRRMMLTDSDGVFLTQREIPKMSLIGAKLTEDGFVFYDKKNPENSLNLPFDVQTHERVNVKVWNHKFSASKISNTFSDWFSDCTAVFGFRYGRIFSVDIDEHDHSAASGHFTSTEAYAFCDC